MLLRQRVLLLAPALVVAVFSLVGCASRTVPLSQDAAPAALPTALPTIVPPNQTVSTTPASVAATDLLRFTLLEGTEARYRVREQLVGVNLPSDAVGVTRSLAGSIVFGPGNVVLPDQSRLTVDLRPLKSDESRRDRYLQNNTLETNRYPEAIFVPREAEGLPSSPPESGSLAFQLVGDLTIRGVTKSVTWDATMTVGPSEISGQATTSFVFSDFGLAVPRVPLVLSVVDNIRLEVDFKLRGAP